MTEQWGIEQAERYRGILFNCFDDLTTNPQLISRGMM